MSVMLDTSTIVLPIPIAAKSTTANAVFVQAAVSASGSPKSISPTPKSRASRLRPASAAAATAPSRPPTPTAALSQPTPALPAWRSRSATITSSTSSAPPTSVWPPLSPITTRSFGSDAIARKPPSSAGRTFSASPSGGAGESAGMRTRHAADQRKAAAVTTKTTHGLLTASSAPPSAGPANMPTLDVVLSATFDAASSSGVRTSEGRSAACAGWNAAPAIEATTARPYTSRVGPCAAATAAMLPTSPARARSAASMTRRREIRSASRASQGANAPASDQRTK